MTTAAKARRRRRRRRRGRGQPRRAQGPWLSANRCYDVPLFNGQLSLILACLLSSLVRPPDGMSCNERSGAPQSIVNCKSARCMRRYRGTCSWHQLSYQANGETVRCLAAVWYLLRDFFYQRRARAARGKTAQFDRCREESNPPRSHRRRHFTLRELQLQRSSNPTTA